MELLRECSNMSKCVHICVDFDDYLLLEGGTFPDDLREVHTDLEAYPTENYIYLYDDDVVPAFFDLSEVGEELDFDTWEEAENYFSKKED